jgi:hypothetical protein
LRNNAYFSSLPAKIQKRLLTADDMYINGRMNALRNIGWSDDHTKAIYKYLSMQAHTMPMSFHRTEANKMYADESEYARVVAGFAVEHARQALGAACLRILALFPDIEGKFSAAALRALKDDYGPQLRNTE